MEDEIKRLRDLLDMIEGICETALKGQDVYGKVSAKNLEHIMRQTARRVPSAPPGQT